MSRTKRSLVGLENWHEQATGDSSRDGRSSMDIGLFLIVNSHKIREKIVNFVVGSFA